MPVIKDYVKVNTPVEAVELLKRPNSVILGGMHWVKMQDGPISVAVDISGLGLDKITETDDEFVIGSAVTLRQLETHEGLNKFTRGALAETVKGIVGVQFRNTASLGGCIVRRSGFSDVITTFLAMDATLHFYEKGEVKLKDFLELDDAEEVKDLLISLSVSKKVKKVSFKDLRLNATDFSVVNVAVAFYNDILSVAVGARPAVARLLEVPYEEALKARTKAEINDFAKNIAHRFEYESNMRGSKEYREHLAGALIGRALEDIFWEDTL